MNINAIPVFGWFLSIGLAASISVPFYFLWNWLGPIYFSFLPPLYLQLPFWHCVGLWVLVPMVKALLFPTISSSSSSTAAKT